MQTSTPPDGQVMPRGPEDFPASGPNSLASKWNRAAARSIDAMLIGVPVLLAAVVSIDYSSSSQSTTLPRWASVVWFAAAVLYESAMVAWRGQTLGKMATGIKVARIDNGRRPLWWQSAIRVLLPALAACFPFNIAMVVYFFEYTTGFWDPTGRALHDRAAGTVVVSVR